MKGDACLEQRDYQTPPLVSHWLEPIAGDAHVELNNSEVPSSDEDNVNLGSQGQLSDFSLSLPSLFLSLANSI